MLTSSKKETLESIQNEVWFLRLKLNFLVENLVSLLLTPEQAKNFRDQLQGITSEMILSKSAIRLSYYKNNSITLEQTYE